jgi:GxxExxY protein
MSHSDYNIISSSIINAAVEVHKVFGPGLLESVYEKALVWEMRQVGLFVQEQVPIDVTFKDLEIKNGYFADIIVEDKIILELKAIENILPVHKAQLLSYLKLADKKLGLLLNFHVKFLKQGITRVINGEL